METRPPTLGEFQAAGWKMQALCFPCDSTDKKTVDLAAEIAKHGADYPTDKWMREACCPKCGRKLSMYDLSPTDQKSVSGGPTWKGFAK